MRLLMEIKNCKKVVGRLLADVNVIDWKKCENCDKTNLERYC